MPIRLTTDMRTVIATQRLCFAATVTPDGKPNLSPKGTIRAWDDHRLFFLDIASPRTVANLRKNPWIELNVVDPLSRRGYRFLGRATIHVDDAVFRGAVDKIVEAEGMSYGAQAAVLVEIERAEPLTSPVYQLISDERRVRRMFRERRAEFEAEYDIYLAANRPNGAGSVRADSSPATKRTPE